MKAIVIYIIGVFVLNCNLYSQILKTDKDTIYILAYSASEYSADTLFVSNIGNSDLAIDSFYNKNYYGYRVNINIADTTIYYFLPGINEPFYLRISPGDTAEFIFSDVDLCPICKVIDTKDNFQDSIYFRSNSLTDSIYGIYSYGDAPSDVEPGPGSPPSEITLLNNYPNPFNPATTIMFSLPGPELLSLTVYNILGEEIHKLLDGYFTSGNHEVTFDARQNQSGIYFYVLRTNTGKIKSKKMILLK